MAPPTQDVFYVWPEYKNFFSFLFQVQNVFSHIDLMGFFIGGELS